MSDRLEAEIASLRVELRRQRRIVAALALLLSAGLLTAFARSREGRHEEFEEIDVGRINVIEPDGTVRLVLSNRSQFPGDWYRGTENARPDRRAFAGMLFVNDEGTEVGGLIFRGAGGDGGSDAALSLTFDRCRQDQVLQLLHAESGGRTQTGVQVNDRPDPRDFSIADVRALLPELETLGPAEREARIAALSDEGKLGQPRAFLGTTRERDSTLALRDAKGRIRLLFQVPADGVPRLELLDESGKVAGRLAVTPVSGG